ncbi:MAG TPA: hypothetical protein VGE83_10135 [Terracidiphilus sp.]|jgi:hypothetical protein
MAKPESIRSMLHEGKGRVSVGRAEEVAALVLAQPKSLSRLLECLWDQDPGVVNRAAHALERVTREGLPGPAAMLNSWKTSLFGLLAEATENKLRWHLALIVPRIALTLPECRRAAEVLQAWLDDPSSSIVKTMSLQGLADLARQQPSLLPMVLDLLRIHSRSGTPAMRARGRLLLQHLEKMRQEYPR